MITQPTTEEVRDALVRSGYLSNLTDKDLKARQYNSIGAKIVDFYMRNISPLTSQDIASISNPVQQVNIYTSPYRRLHNIPWKIVKFSAYLENGFPHTHADIIFLPQSRLSVKQERDMQLILAHEKVHVYQRLYPLEANLFIKDVLGCRVSTLRHLHPSHSAFRSNPDINTLIYKDTYMNEIVPIYTSNHPRNLSEIQDKRDHPFEMMAYMLADVLLGLKNTDESTRAWMDKHL